MAAESFEARHAGEQANLAQTDDLTALLNRRGLYIRAAAILSGKGFQRFGGADKCAAVAGSGPPRGRQ